MDQLGDDGYFKNWKEWKPTDAHAISENCGILLGNEHWQVINIVREYYKSYRLFPPNRVLINLMSKEEGLEKADSIYLMQLFSGTPARVLAKIAGLPKPADCD